MQKQKQEHILILNDIRSVENVGAMFRTSDAAGIDKIFVTGYTPTPLDRFDRKRNDFHKSALGAEDFVKWEQKKDVIALIKKLKKEGYMIIGIEQAPNSINYKKIKLQNKNVFIVGAEVTGIPKSVLKHCDVIAEIPMKGRKESLNVSVALGVILFGCLVK